MTVLSVLTVTAVWISCGSPGGRSIEQPPKAAAPAPVSSEASTGKLIDVFETLVPRILDDAGVPGAGVAVVHQGRIVYQRGFGYADKDKKQMVGDTTGFNIGSISKTVAAWGVMKLVEDGKLELDAPVSNYLTRWQLPKSEHNASGVTVRRLLSHTAGLSLHGYPGFGPEDTLPSLEESLSGKTNGAGSVELIMAPGTEWKYSGGGYTLAQLLVEEITGVPFARYMRESVLRPLGMKNSDYDLTAEILASSATCYDGWGNATANPRFTAQAAAGLHTTIADLARFAAAGLSGPAGARPGRGVLRPESIALMLAAAPATDGEYGLGYAIDSLPDGSKSTGHGGANRGWHAYFTTVAKTGEGIVVTTNGDNGSAVHMQIRCAWTKWLTGSFPAGDRCKKPVLLPVVRALSSGSGEQARDVYLHCKNNLADQYFFSENQLNRVGYQLLAHKRVADAIVIFQLNVSEYPDAFNTHDSLGEAYLLAGKRELSLASYRKSLELNPNNEHARQIIEKLDSTPSPVPANSASPDPG